MRLLVLCAALGLLLAAPTPGEAQGRRPAKGRTAAPAKKAPRFGPVTLYHLNLRETLVYRPYDAKGRVRPTELRRFSRFMRDGKGRVGRMHPRLATLFYRVAQHYAGQRVEVISGYRPDARNPRSPHRKGLAVDFRVQGVRNADLRDYLRKGYSKVGVGYYPNSVFVHFDVRERSAFWIDYSGPGQEAIYSPDPDGDLRSGRADTWKPPRRPPTSAPVNDSSAGDDAPPPGEDSAEPPAKAEPAPEGDEAREGGGGAKPDAGGAAKPDAGSAAKPDAASAAKPDAGSAAKPAAASAAKPAAAPKPAPPAGVQSKDATAKPTPAPPAPAAPASRPAP